MSDSQDLFIEPERYELHAGPVYHFDLERRDFFKMVGGGIVVLLALPGASAQDPQGRGRRGGGRGGGGGTVPEEIGAWLHIDESGAVTVYSGKAEVGQGIRTSLTQAVAEELHVATESIRMVLGDTDLTPYDRGTFGSQTTPRMAPQLRRAAAAARELLVARAAERWDVKADSIRVADGVVSARGGRSARFGELTQGQKLVQTITAVETVPAEQWQVSGRVLSKVMGRAIATGEHRYASDMKLPGMLYGKVLRPAAFEANLVSLDAEKAESTDGVTVVRDGNFVGVAATTEQMAVRAIADMSAEWESAAQISAEELFMHLRETGGNDGELGSEVADGLDLADMKLQQTYTCAYIQHVPLETRAALAQWEDGKLTVWTGTQRPFGVRSELAQAFRIPEERVRVIVPDTGSGYGGKHNGEAAVEAARLARASGQPVRVQWTREEEFTWAYFRPAGVMEIASGVSKDGRITAWEHHNYNSGSSAIRSLYAIPHQHTEFHRTEYPLRQGSYRGLAATANHFARESHMDELAHLVPMDPLAFRLLNLEDPRMRAVLEAAAERLGWSDRQKQPDKGFGLACGFEKGSYVANCAEVTANAETGEVRVERVVSVFECGAVVNPDGLRNQIEGSLIQGLGGALFEAIDFGNGKIRNPTFSEYRLPRFTDLPDLDTVILDRVDLPSAGAGETPIVCVAPAVGNAIFDASGIRLRALPMVPRGLKKV